MAKEPMKSSLWLLHKVLGFFLILTVLLGCNPVDSSENGTEDSLSLIDYPSAHPTIPEGVAGLAVTSGAEFIPSLPNDLEKVDSYLSRLEKSALNLGVYAMDAAYLIGYEKIEEYIQYIEVCKRLAVEIGVPDEYHREFGNRLESNLANPDSLQHILDELIRNAKASLTINDQAAHAQLIALGGLVEEMYIECEVLKSIEIMMSRANASQKQAIMSPIMKSILKQKESVIELNRQLKTTMQSKHINELSNSLNSVESALALIAHHPQSPDDDLTLEKFNDVIAQVEALRTRIIR